MIEPDVTNVPAYQRKRSLAAKARKKTTAQKLAARKTVRKATSRSTTLSTNYQNSIQSRLNSSRTRYPDNLLVEDMLSNIPADEIPHSINQFEEPEITQTQPFSQQTTSQSISRPLAGLGNNTSSNQTREMKLVGRCDGYFEKIDVAVVKLTNTLQVGDQIIFQKLSGLFEQPVDSMQIDRKDVNTARAGDDIGLKVNMEPKVGGLVYKVI